MQAAGQRDQSEAASEADEAEPPPPPPSANAADLSNSPEGVADWATNNKHVDSTNNIIAAEAELEAVEANQADTPTSSDVVNERSCFQRVFLPEKK